jgi:hypothetical protein
MTLRSTALRLELAAGVRLLAAGVLVVAVLPGCLQERCVMFDLVLLLRWPATSSAGAALGLRVAFGSWAPACAEVVPDSSCLLLKRPTAAGGMPGKADSRAEGAAAAPFWEAASRKAAADTIISRAMAPLRACCLLRAAMLASC